MEYPLVNKVTAVAVVEALPPLKPRRLAHTSKQPKHSSTACSSCRTSSRRFTGRATHEVHGQCRVESSSRPPSMMVSSARVGSFWRIQGSRVGRGEIVTDVECDSGIKSRRRSRADELKEEALLRSRTFRREQVKKS